MRICLYSEHILPSIGGKQLVVDALARHLTSLGQEVVVLAPSSNRVATADYHSTAYAVEYHPSFYSSWWFVRWYSHFLSKIHRKYRFQLLHCHGVYPIGYVATCWAKDASIPLVITSHGDITPCAARLKRPGLQPRFCKALNEAQALIAISDDVEEQYRQLCPRANRILQIPNGVDLTCFDQTAPRPACLPEAIRPKEYVLYLGRLIDKKGVVLLLEAFSKMAHRNSVHLVFAGQGEALDSLQSRVEQLGLTNRVHFVGQVVGPVKTYLFQQAFFTCVPSIASEGSPLNVLESYAAGRPVIGTHVPGLHSMIEPGKTGTIIEPNSVSQLAKAMTEFVTQRPWVEEMGKQAHQFAQSRDWQKVASRHLKLYQELVDTTSTSKSSKSSSEVPVYFQSSG